MRPLSNLRLRPAAPASLGRKFLFDLRPVGLSGFGPVDSKAIRWTSIDIFFPMTSALTGCTLGGTAGGFWLRYVDIPWSKLRPERRLTPVSPFGCRIVFHFTGFAADSRAYAAR